MTIYFKVVEGTNRAICRICGEKIKKREHQVTATGFRNGGSVHLNCLIKKAKNIEGMV